jgi:hypothetical protein
MAYTIIPDVRAALQDTILPAALANLPATITVAGNTVALRKPEIHYGTPATGQPPNSLVVIGPSDGDDQQFANLPDNQTRSREERFSITMMIWYLIGDTSPAAQRVATESSFQIYRTIQGYLRTGNPWQGILSAPYTVNLERVSDRDFNVAEGRGSMLDCNLSIFTKV